ncbi:MAG TPA: P-II family nitrogen regulator [Balneolaceae bacterium]|nr:P-II family nitrogen regulator [Balneolaceae bacterium]
MKSVMIVCNMIVSEEVHDALRRLKIRGFTQWNEIQGSGTDTGEPHLGSHTWPSLNSAIMVILKEERVDELLSEIKKIEEGARQQGVRAFVWDIEKVF